MSVFSTGPGAGIYTKQSTDVLGLGATVDANGAFVSSTGPIIRFGATNPSGVVTANAGSLSLSSGAAYISRGGTTWNTFTSVPSGSKGGFQLYNLTTQTTGVGDNTSGAQVVLPNTLLTLAAGSLQPGSSLRIRLVGAYFVGAGAPATAITVRLNLGANTMVTWASTALAAGTQSATIADYNLSVLTAGAGGTAVVSVQTVYAGTSFSVISNSSPVNTTIDNAMSVSVQFNNAFVGTNFNIFGYTVDFYQ